MENRTYKFRAYSPMLEKMFYNAVVFIGGNIVVDTALDEVEGGVVYSQYTGLKDKNGKEIYDGDIIEFDGLENAKIVWGDCGYDLIFNSEIVHLDSSHSNRLKIIGNIYE